MTSNKKVIDLNLKFQTIPHLAYNIKESFIMRWKVQCQVLMMLFCTKSMKTYLRAHNTNLILEENQSTLQI